MNFERFLAEQDVTENPQPKRPADVIMWVPPGGTVVECPSMEMAKKAAEAFAGRHPGSVAAVYQFVGFAHVPAKAAEFIPAGQKAIEQ